MRASRRALIAGGATLGAAAVALPFLIDGRTETVTPAEARWRGAQLKTFSNVEAATLEALGETLLPGAAEAGIAHFVDHHLSVPAGESMLLVRYLEVPEPYAEFYRGGLAALERVSGTRHDRGFAALDPQQSAALIGALLGGQVEGWKGPPAMPFYLAVRSDAVDVVYGTVRGFERLGVPYMPHIEPERPW